MPEFYNPSNGHKVVVINWHVFLGAFLFGPIFSLCIDEIGNAMANFAVGLFLCFTFKIASFGLDMLLLVQK